MPPMAVRIVIIFRQTQRFLYIKDGYQSKQWLWMVHHCHSEWVIEATEQQESQIMSHLRKNSILTPNGLKRQAGSLRNNHSQ